VASAVTQASKKTVNNATGAGYDSRRRGSLPTSFVRTCAATPNNVWSSLHSFLNLLTFVIASVRPAGEALPKEQT